MEGSWDLDRQIQDHLTNQTGQLKGQADFTSMAPGLKALLYTESGELDYGAYSDSSEQSYLYETTGDHTAEVFFSDGRLFHHLDLKDGECDVSHLCGEDMYKGKFLLKSPNSLEISWTVTGPRKNYELLSILTKPICF